MDPKQLAQLDPKLREAYDRVMGTNVAQPSQKAEQSQSPEPIHPAQPAQPATPPVQSAHMEQPKSEVVMPQPTTQPPLPSSEPQPYNPVHSQAPANPSQPPSIGASMAFNAHKQTGKGGKKSMLSGIAIGLGVIVLLVAYTFIWVKVFNLSLPFLS